MMYNYLVSLGNGKYQYNGQYGTVTFDVSNISASDANLSNRMLQSLDFIASTAATQGGSAATFYQNLNGKTVSYYSDATAFLNAAGVTDSTQQNTILGSIGPGGSGPKPTGLTFNGSTDSPVTWIDSGLNSIQQVLQSTFHEGLHDGGLDHGDPIFSPGSSNYTYPSQSWNDLVSGFMNEVFGKAITDPVTNTQYGLYPQKWTMEDSSSNGLIADSDNVTYGSGGVQAGADNSLTAISLEFSKASNGDTTLTFGESGGSGATLTIFDDRSQCPFQDFEQK